MTWYNKIQAQRRDDVAYSDMGEIVIDLPIDMLAPAIPRYLHTKMFIYPISTWAIPDGRFAFLIEPIAVDTPSVARDEHGNIRVAENLGHTTPAAYGIVWLRKRSAQQSIITVTPPPKLNSDASPLTDEEYAYVQLVETHQERIGIAIALEESVANGHEPTDQERDFFADVKRLTDGQQAIIFRKLREVNAAQQQRHATQNQIIDYCLQQIVAEQRPELAQPEPVAAPLRGREHNPAYDDAYQALQQGKTRKEAYALFIERSATKNPDKGTRDAFGAAMRLRGKDEEKTK